jgi:hypothetical protein
LGYNIKFNNNKTISLSQRTYVKKILHQLNTNLHVSPIPINPGWKHPEDAELKPVKATKVNEYQRLAGRLNWVTD